MNSDLIDYCFVGNKDNLGMKFQFASVFPIGEHKAFILETSCKKEKNFLLMKGKIIK